LRIDTAQFSTRSGVIDGTVISFLKVHQGLLPIYRSRKGFL
jgi:hypothetical protein